MKNKDIQNSNGIVIRDSIIMSVKKKRRNFRIVEAVIIAVCGYAAAIFSFFSMFDIYYNKAQVCFSAILFSAVYITLALMGKRGIKIAAGSIFIAMFAAYRHIEKLALGFKYIYNRIYSLAYHTEISYYKFLKPEFEADSATAFIILYLWGLALTIYIFTIYRPNSIPPLIVSFPVLEIGLYNGMEVSVFWGMLLVGYWLAIFAMTTIDMGEYSGGSGGFVRKENLFFPKRQMKLKVTEKCGIFVIAEILAITAITAGTMKLLDYKRSDELNRKRSDVRDAVNSFSIDDIAGSVSNITSAFGFTFSYQTHKLGNVDRLRYKDTTDLIVDVDRFYNSAIYLKEFTGTEYSSDKWTSFSDDIYDNSLFDDFGKYSLHPQDFPYIMNQLLAPNSEDYTISIDSKVRNNRSFAPYGTNSLGISEYNFDRDVTSKKKSSDVFTYKFSPYSPDSVIPNLSSNRLTCFTERISQKEWKDRIYSFCKDNALLMDDGGRDYFMIDSPLSIAPADLYDSPDSLMTMLMEGEYEKFVYDNYLQVPDSVEMEEVRTEFLPLLANTDKMMSAGEKIAKLDALRQKVSSMVEYSLTPGRTPNNRDFVNYFLLENKKGYCTHYASAGVLLARMAGIPARYATGYVIVGDDFCEENCKSDGSYTITVKDNRSHAWIEVYLSGYGWVPYEFTAGYSLQSIDTTPVTTTVSTDTSVETTTTAATQNTTDETSESKLSNTVTSSAAETTAVVATNASSVVSGEGTVHEQNGKAHLSITPAVKYTLYTLLLIAAFIGAALLRRIMILRHRNKRMSEGTPEKRMRYIYGYTEKLLGLMDIQRDDESRMEFAEKVEKALGGVMFPEGGFIGCTDAALRAAFSAVVPDASEADKHKQFADELAKKLYNGSKPLRRFMLKFVNVIQ